MMNVGSILSEPRSTERLKGSTDEAIRFLKEFDPTGWHNLVVINPEGGDLEGRTFAPNSENAVRKFIEEYNGRWNIYYSVNEPKPNSPNKKLKKKNIGRIRAVHLDLDAPNDARQDPAGLSELKATIKSTIDAIERNAAAPEIGAIIDSGGGFNVLWFLDEKLPAPENTEAVEAQNYGLLKLFGADPGTHNIDRLLRLPGTVNLPNKIKRKRGRQISVSKLVNIYPSDPTDLDDLAAWVAPVAPKREADAPTAVAIELDMDAIKECATFDDLPEDLRERFHEACEKDPKLQRLWGGDSSVLGKDKSGSGFSLELAARLKQLGGFTATEFGMLVHVWDYSSADKDKINARYIERAWTRSRDPGPSAEDEFEPLPPLSMQWVQSLSTENIKPREWIAGTFAAARNVTGLIAPGGAGKTTFLIALALAVATGRDDIIGMPVHKKGRVLLWNQEDEKDELQRRLVAAAAHFNIPESEVIDKILIGSGVDRRLVIDKRVGDRIVASKDATEIEEAIKTAGDICLAIFDPLVELHSADENNNGEMAAVTGIFREIAVRTNCAVVLAHHTRKPPNAANRESYAGNMDAARGAGSINFAARIVCTLYTVDPNTAKAYGIAEGDCRLYVRLDDAKANMSLLSGDPRFFKRESVLIDGFGGDPVGVLRPVKLARRLRSTETKAEDDARTREAVVALLHRAEGHRMAVTTIADDLIDTGVAEDMSSDTLQKRLKTMFENPQTYENGYVIRSETCSVKGKPGRSALLILEIAESSK